MSAVVSHIFLRPAARLPVQRPAFALAIPGRGLRGDHATSDARQVTLLDLGAWRRAMADLGADVNPGARRANLALDALDLRDTVGRQLRLGPVLLEVTKETRPCELLDAAHPGLSAALRSEWRGGVCARVLIGGEVRVGDTADWVRG